MIAPRGPDPASPQAPRRLSAGDVLHAASGKRIIAMQAVIVVVLLASAQAYDGSIHALSHWIVLGAYVGCSILVGLAENWTRGTLPADDRRTALFAWVSTILNAGVAIYFEIEHMLTGALEGYDDAASAVSRLPAFLLLLQTALTMRVWHTAVFCALVASVWGTALALAWFYTTSMPLGPQISLTEEAPALLSFIVAGLVVIDGTWRMRSAVATAIRLEQERAQLARFVPGSVAQHLVDEGGFGEARERHACLLAIDIRGFSRMTRERPRQEVVRTLLNVRALAQAAIGEHGGVIDKYVGDGILAQFFVGSPQQQAEAALGAAQTILARAETLNEERASEGLQPLRLAIALHAGQVLAGVFDDGRRAEFTVLGPAMNMLARLETRVKAAERPLGASADLLALLPGVPSADAIEDGGTPDLFALGDIEGGHDVAAELCAAH